MNRNSYEQSLMDKINDWTGISFQLSQVLSTQLSPTLEDSIYSLGFEDFGNFYQNVETNVILSHLHIEYMLENCWRTVQAPTIVDLRTFFTSQLLHMFEDKGYEPGSHEQSLWDEIIEFDEDVAKELRQAYIQQDEDGCDDGDDDDLFLSCDQTEEMDAAIVGEFNPQEQKIRQYFPKIHSSLDFDTTKWEDAEMYLTQESNAFTVCCSDLCYLLFEHIVDDTYRSEDAYRTYRSGGTIIHVPQSLITLLQDRVDRQLPVFFSFVPWDLEEVSLFKLGFVDHEKSERDDSELLDFILINVVKAVELMLPNYLED